jgi:hypothetical protein
MSTNFSEVSDNKTASGQRQYGKEDRRVKTSDKLKSFTLRTIQCKYVIFYNSIIRLLKLAGKLVYHARYIILQIAASIKNIQLFTEAYYRLHLAPLASCLAARQVRL